MESPSRARNHHLARVHDLDHRFQCDHVSLSNLVFKRIDDRRTELSCVERLLSTSMVEIAWIKFQLDAREDYQLSEKRMAIVKG